MSAITRIKDQLQRAYDGDAWYGPSLKETLKKIGHEQANMRPIAHSHTIWEILLHIIAWQNAVVVRLKERRVALPDEGDWPTMPEVTEYSWQQTLLKLSDSHDELMKTIAELSDEQLDETIGKERQRETGSGVSLSVTLQGVIEHNVYHAGQISLLKKLTYSISRN